MALSVGSHQKVYEIKKLIEPEISLLDSLTCPVCMNLMNGRIFQCIRGHSFCCRCYNQLLVCALCKGSLHYFRNVITEQLFQILITPCKHRAEGCLFMGNGERRAKHEVVCVFRSMRCPLRDKRQCSWIGGFLDFGRHCDKMHGKQVVNGECTSSTICLVKSWALYVPFITKIGRHIFLWKIRRHHRTRALHVDVRPLGELTEDKEYAFGVEFTDVLDLERFVKIEGLCTSEYPYTKYVKADKLRLCENLEGKLLITFRIFDRKKAKISPVDMN